MQLPAKIGPAVRILRDSLIVTHRKLVVSVKAPLAVWVAQGNDRFIGKIASIMRRKR